MKLSRHFTLALLLVSALSLNAENQDHSQPAADSDRHHDRDRDRDRDRDHRDCDCDRDNHNRERCELRGTYGYSLSGNISPDDVLADPFPLNEAGSLTFDGRGSGTGSATSVINVAPFRLTATYTFTYTWLSPFVALASGMRTDSFGTYNIQAVIGVGEQAETIGIVLLPNAILSTTIPQSFLNFVQVSGNGGK